MSMPPEFNGEGGFEILVPFTCVESEGGTYDDRSFIAGYQIGAIDRTLSEPACVTMTALVFEELEHQCDLLAMHHNGTFSVLQRYDGWIHIGFQRIMHEEIPS